MCMKHGIVLKRGPLIPPSQLNSISPNRSQIQQWSSQNSILAFLILRFSFLTDKILGERCELAGLLFPGLRNPDESKMAWLPWMWNPISLWFQISPSPIALISRSLSWLWLMSRWSKVVFLLRQHAMLFATFNSIKVLLLDYFDFLTSRICLEGFYGLSMMLWNFGFSQRPKVFHEMSSYFKVSFCLSPSKSLIAALFLILFQCKSSLVITLLFCNNYPIAIPPKYILFLAMLSSTKEWFLEIDSEITLAPASPKLVSSKFKILSLQFNFWRYVDIWTKLCSPILF